MIWGGQSAKLKHRCFATVLAVSLVAPLASGARAEEFGGPTFRKGLWHFVRTLDLVAHRKTKHRLMERELTACVDPTLSMKATFSSPSVGGCVSSKPEKSANTYRFANRCDFMGPVSTVITVDSEEAYTEVNELNKGEVPRVEQVVAKRLGDCGDAVSDTGHSATLTH